MPDPTDPQPEALDQPSPADPQPEHEALASDLRPSSSAAALLPTVARIVQVLEPLSPAGRARVVLFVALEFNALGDADLQHLLEAAKGR